MLIKTWLLILWFTFPLLGADAEELFALPRFHEVTVIRMKKTIATFSLSYDGNQLIVSDKFNTISLWAPHDLPKEPIWQFNPHLRKKITTLVSRGSLTEFALVQNSRIGFFSFDRLAEKKKKIKISDLFEPIVNIAFTPDGGKLAAIHKQGRIDVHAINHNMEFKMIREIGEEKDFISSLTFSPDGSSLVVLTKQGAEILSVDETEKVKRTIPSPNEGIPWKNSTFTPDGKHLVLCDAEGLTAVYNFPALEFYVSDVLKPPAQKLAFINSNVLIGVTSIENRPTRILSWNIHSKVKHAQDRHIYGAKPHKIAISGDGKTVAFQAGKEIKIWILKPNAPTGEEMAAAPSSTEGPPSRHWLWQLLFRKRLRAVYPN